MSERIANARASTSRAQSRRQKRGSAWEAEIARENAQLFEAGNARVVRANEPYRVIGTHADRSPKVVRTKRSEPDFYGVAKGGRFVAFDAKRTQDNRFALPNPRKPAKGWQHQIDALAAIAALGGLAFLYVLHDDDQTVWTVDAARYVLPVTSNGFVAGLDPVLNRAIRLDEQAARCARGASWLDVVATNLHWWTS